MVLKKFSNRLRWAGYAVVLGLLSAGNVQSAENAQLTTAPKGRQFESGPRYSIN